MISGVPIGHDWHGCSQLSYANSPGSFSNSECVAGTVRNVPQGCATRWAVTRLAVAHKPVELVGSGVLAVEIVTVIGADVVGKKYVSTPGRAVNVSIETNSRYLTGGIRFRPCLKDHEKREEGAEQCCKPRPVGLPHQPESWWDSVADKAMSVQDKVI